LQPFLVATLLVYFNNENPWIYFAFAGLAGLFVDSFTGVFGLHAILFIFIVLLLKSAQLTFLTSRNILSIFVLTISSFIFYWLLFWLLNFIFDWQLYYFSWQTILAIAKVTWLNMLILWVAHVLIYNIWTKNHEQKQSF
jgi:cell shape-determining protein MreD